MGGWFLPRRRNSQFFGQFTIFRTAFKKAHFAEKSCYYHFNKDLPWTIVKISFGLFRVQLIGLRISTDLCFHCLMDVNLRLHFCLSKSQKLRGIQKRRIKLILKWNDGFEHKHEFFICLHCRKINSKSGSYHHRQTFIMSDEETQRRFNELTSDFEGFTTRVKKVFERRFDDGRLRGRRSIQEEETTIPVFSVQFQPTPRPLLPPVSIPRRRTVHRVEEHPQRPEPLHEEMHEDTQNDELPEFPELMSCFSNEGFDPRRFGQFAEYF